MVRVGLREKVTSEQSLEGGEELACGCLKEDHPGRGKSQCKGPEAGRCLMGLRHCRWPVCLEGDKEEVRVRGRWGLSNWFLYERNRKPEKGFEGRSGMI